MNDLIIKDREPRRFRPIQDILKDEAAANKLANLIDQANTAKVKISLLQAEIKACKDAARKDLDLDPALFTYYLAMTFNNDYTQRKSKVDQLAALIDSVMAIAGPAQDQD